MYLLTDERGGSLDVVVAQKDQLVLDALEAESDPHADAERAVVVDVELREGHRHGREGGARHRGARRHAADPARRSEARRSEARRAQRDGRQHSPEVSSAVSVVCPEQKGWGGI